ncbi:hypothetical protein FQR65_LT16088 [Abscondita terminalis]|nr:hypothetical protein FQR65_LT16088 [Abscondita terminalis]
MSPVVKKNTSIILLDVNTTPEFRTASKNYLRKVFASKWFSESKDYTKLILINTEKTDNKLHRRFGRAPHICEVTGMIEFDPRLIDSYLDGEEEVGKGNWLVALAFAIEEIRENYGDDKGAITLQILLISDFSSPVHEFKEKQVHFITTSLNTLGIFLYIVGPQVKVPKQVSDVRKWMYNVEFISNVNTNQLQIIKKIVENTKNSVVCDLNLGFHLFLNYKNPKSLQMWHVPLTAGKTVAIPSSTTRFLGVVNPPSMKKDELSIPWTWHLTDDVMVTVAYENVIGGIIKHGQFIPLPYDVEKNFKCYGERRFEIIGFTNRNNVSEVHMRGNGSSFVQSSSRIFNLLVHCLVKKNLCAIARKVHIKNCKPKLMALLPHVQEKGFIAVELPYKENISVKVTEEDIQVADTLSVNKEYDFLTQLDVANEDNKDENGSVRFPLVPTLMTPIRLSLMNNLLFKKYTGEEMDSGGDEIMQLGIDFANYLHLCPARAPPAAVNDDV